MTFKVMNLWHSPLLIEANFAESLRVNYAALEQNILTESSHLNERPKGARYRVEKGVAVISINGLLLHNYHYIGSWASGYEEILKQTSLAASDPDVKGILRVFDSPGGMVAGCFDCARSLKAIKTDKPVWSLANDMAASAALALGSVADKRLITASAGMGSLGAVSSHVSYKKRLEKDGIKITLIYAGKHKVDGNPYQDIPEGTVERYRSELEGIRQEFAALVADNTGQEKMFLLETEAAMYHGQAAVDAGFADERVNGNDAVDYFADVISHPITVGVSMSTTPQAPETSPGADSPSTEPDLSAVKKAERDRVSAILQCDEAKGREKLAHHLAFHSDMSAEDVKVLLENSEKKTAASAPAKNPLDVVMAGETHVTVTGSPHDNQGADDGEDDAVAMAKVFAGNKE